MLIRLTLVLWMVFGALVHAAAALSATKIQRVIYLTLDGVRWQDVSLNHQYFPKLWQKYAASGVFYGIPEGKNPIYTASIPVSLPSYQSQMAGEVQACLDNSCGRISVQTLPEYLVNQLHVAKNKVAIFSSWPEIAYAAEHIQGTTFTNTGNKPVSDSMLLNEDTMTRNLNQKQKSHHPHGQDRYDQYTFAQAWHYFKTYKPLFLWIALNDADEAAHSGNSRTYYQTLNYYDDLIDIVFTYLKDQHWDKDTLVIITTDHGRGAGVNWTKHGKEYSESRQIWAFVMNGVLEPRNVSGENYSLLAIRPTVEKALLDKGN